MRKKNFDFLELEILPYIDELKGKSIQEVINFVKNNYSEYKLIRFDWQGSYYNFDMKKNIVYKQNLLEI